MSVFLDCFKNNGYDYLRIVDGRRYKKADGKISNRRITIKNLGLLKKYDDGQGEGLLNRVRERFRNRTLEIGMPYEEIDHGSKMVTPAIRKAEATLRYKNIGYFVLEAIMNSLGVTEILREAKNEGEIEYDMVGLSKLMVYGRVLRPRSKKTTFEGRDRYLFGVTCSEEIKEIYKALDVLDKKSGQIQARMNTRVKRSSIGRKMEVTYYDVTNYYFETMYGDEDVYETDESGEVVRDEKGKPVVRESRLRKKGVSKERRSGPNLCKYAMNGI